MQAEVLSLECTRASKGPKSHPITIGLATQEDDNLPLAPSRLA